MQPVPTRSRRQSALVAAISTRAAFSESSRASQLTPATNYNNRTYMQVLTAEGPFTAVRMLVGNADPANAVTVGPFGVSATGAATDLNPSTGAMTPMLFGGQATVTLPAAVNANRPRLAWSDWTPVRSIARTDGGLLPLLMARAEFTSTTLAPTGPVMDPYWESGDAALNGHMVRNRRHSAGFAQAAAGWGGTSFVNFSAIVGIEFRYARPVVSIVTFGDSITEAAAITNKYASHFHLAAFALATPERPMSVQNYGRSGESPAQYAQRAIDYLTATDANGQYVNHPVALVYAIGSPNDGDFTAAVAATARVRAYQVADLCRDRGVIFMPASVTPRTNGTNTASANSDDSHRQALNAEFMALRGGGIIPIDVAGAITSTTNPALYRSTADFLTGDGVHPSDLGTQAMAEAAQVAFARLLAA